MRGFVGVPFWSSSSAPSLKGLKIQDFLAAAESKDAEEWMARGGVGAPVAPAFQSAKKFCHAVPFSFQISTHGESSIDDVEYFMQYSGPDVWRKTVKGILKNPEPAGPNYTECKYESRGLLRKLYHEAVKTTATEGPALKLMETLNERLRSQDLELKHHCCRDLAAPERRASTLKQAYDSGYVTLHGSC